MVILLESCICSCVGLISMIMNAKTTVQNKAKVPNMFNVFQLEWNRVEKTNSGLINNNNKSREGQ